MVGRGGIHSHALHVATKPLGHTYTFHGVDQSWCGPPTIYSAIAALFVTSSPPFTNQSSRSLLFCGAESRKFGFIRERMSAASLEQLAFPLFSQTFFPMEASHPIYSRAPPPLLLDLKQLPREDGPPSETQLRKAKFEVCSHFVSNIGKFCVLT